MRRLVALLAAVAACAAGCGGDDAQDVLRETAGNLRDIRSGTLDMRMTVDGTGAASQGGAVGFALRGPFSLPKGGGLPEVRMAYTQLAGDRRATVTLTATGDAAFITVAGKAYELPAEQADRLRAGVDESAPGESLRIGEWVRDPKLSDGGRVGGAETDRITARLDVRAAARDLLRVSAALGPGDAATRSLEGASGEELERAVKRATFELHTGKEDRILRRLDIGVELAARGVPGARIRFRLDLSDPGKRVDVKPPKDPLPSSALPRG